MNATTRTTPNAAMSTTVDTTTHPPARAAIKPAAKLTTGPAVKLTTKLAAKPAGIMARMLARAHVRVTVRAMLRAAAPVAARIAALALLLALLFRTAWFAPFFAWFVERGVAPVYTRDSLLFLTLCHLALVAVSSTAGTLFALAAGIFVTRPAGAAYLPVARSLVNISQTFPPVVVLALAVPVVGFGAKPVLLALMLYGLLPVFESTIAALNDVPASVLDAARAMGLSRAQRLFSVELPLALPVILNGIRLAVVVNLGTAAIGSTVAAKSLGDAIIAGLQTSNTAFVLQGGLVIALLAILLYDALGYAGRALTRWQQRG